jgi:hypothetical protein
LHENSSGRFLARGDVEEFLCGLWLVTAKLVHQGSAVQAGPDSRDDIDIANLGKFMALSRERSDVVPQGFPLLLLATLQILGIAESYVRALEVFGKAFLEIL